MTVIHLHFSWCKCHSIVGYVNNSAFDIEENITTTACKIRYLRLY